VIKVSKDKSASTAKKKKVKKKIETLKGIGLFDHIKHIRCVQDPDYFKNLTDLDKKSFNPFMILKALSMNPDLLVDMADLFKFFDKIPHPQLYQLLIGLVPIEDARVFHRWIKPAKKPYGNYLISLTSKYFEISKNEAEDYIRLLFFTDAGRNELKNLCEEFGLSDKEVELVIAGEEEGDDE